jgi:hypothetical protein
VDPGGSWLPPAGRCPAVQQWHGAREMSLGKFGPSEIVDDPLCKSSTAQGTRASGTQS